jgi:hypothetical protein
MRRAENGEPCAELPSTRAHTDTDTHQNCKIGITAVDRKTAVVAWTIISSVSKLRESFQGAHRAAVLRPPLQQSTQHRAPWFHRVTTHRLLLSGAPICLGLGRLALHTTHALSIGFGYLRADDGSWVTMGCSARGRGGEGRRLRLFDTEESPKDPLFCNPSLVHSPCNAQGMQNNKITINSSQRGAHTLLCVLQRWAAR